MTTQSCIYCGEMIEEIHSLQHIKECVVVKLKGNLQSITEENEALVKALETYTVAPWVISEVAITALRAVKKYDKDDEDENDPFPHVGFAIDKSNEMEYMMKMLGCIEVGDGIYRHPKSKFDFDMSATNPKLIVIRLGEIFHEHGYEGAQRNIRESLGM